MSESVATHQHTKGEVNQTIEFLKRTRFELRELRKVRVWKDKFVIYDINGDSFEVRQVGYPDPDIQPLLNHINTAYNPDTIHEETTEEFKEFKTGRRRPWAEDRVM